VPYSGVSWQQQMHVRMEPSPILPEWSSIELLLCIHGAWVDELFRWCGDVAWRMIVRMYLIRYHTITVATLMRSGDFVMIMKVKTVQGYFVK